MTIPLWAGLLVLMCIHLGYRMYKMVGLDPEDLLTTAFHWGLFWAGIGIGRYLI